MSGEDTEQLKQQIQQLTDELDAAYQQIANNTERIIPFWILDLGFGILKALPVGSFRNSNVPSFNPNGITDLERRLLELEQRLEELTRERT